MSITQKMSSFLGGGATSQGLPANYTVSVHPSALLIDYAAVQAFLGPTHALDKLTPYLAFSINGDRRTRQNLKHLNLKAAEGKGTGTGVAGGTTGPFSHLNASPALNVAAPLNLYASTPADVLHIELWDDNIFKDRFLALGTLALSNVIVPPGAVPAVTGTAPAIAAAGQGLPAPVPLSTQAPGAIQSIPLLGYIAQAGSQAAGASHGGTGGIRGAITGLLHPGGGGAYTAPPAQGSVAGAQGPVLATVTLNVVAFPATGGPGGQTVGVAAPAAAGVAGAGMGAIGTQPTGPMAPGQQFTTQQADMGMGQQAGVMGAGVGSQAGVMAAGVGTQAGLGAGGMGGGVTSTGLASGQIPAGGAVPVTGVTEVASGGAMGAGMPSGGAMGAGMQQAGVGGVMPGAGGIAGQQQAGIPSGHGVGLGGQAAIGTAKHSLGVGGGVGAGTGSQATTGTTGAAGGVNPQQQPRL